ncbi:MAG: FAD-dependent oxidoreductase, partial [Pseudomonadota bacterium]
MSLPKKKVAIIGAGIGGLTAAALLAGYADVHVYERDQRPGGKVRQVHWGNRSIDCGPTVFTLKGVFDDIFERCGERLEDYVDLKPLDILARHAWPDGGCLDLYADQNQTYDAIEEFAGRREADAYLGFLRMAQRAWETVEQPFIRRPEPRLSSMVFSAKPEALLRLDPYLSFWRSLSRRFKDERLRQLFGRYATYCGSSPFKAPSTLALIAYIEQQGVWSLSGGMHALADALVRVAEKRGAQFHYGSDISQLLISSGEVQGLEGSGEEQSDVVVFNGDGSALRAQGAISDEPGDAARTPSAKRTQSAVTVCFTGQASGLKPSVHNVLFSNDYEAEFDDVFDRSAVPEQPTVYVFAPDAEDQTTTSQRYFCLMNAPADGDRRDYTEEDQRQCQSKILACPSRDTYGSSSTKLLFGSKYGSTFNASSSFSMPTV